jgi:hypothetical protein
MLVTSSESGWAKRMAENKRKKSSFGKEIGLGFWDLIY